MEVDTVVWGYLFNDAATVNAHGDVSLSIYKQCCLRSRERKCIYFSIFFQALSLPFIETLLTVCSILRVSKIELWSSLSALSSLPIELLFVTDNSSFLSFLNSFLPFFDPLLFPGSIFLPSVSRDWIANLTAIRGEKRR